MNFRYPFLKQVLRTSSSHAVDVNQWYQIVEVSPGKRNAMLGKKIMVDDPFIPGWRLGMERAKSPPGSRFARRRHFVHEFQRDIGALNPICPFGTSALHVFVQPFNRFE